MHIFLGRLTDNNASWNYLHVVSMEQEGEILVTRKGTKFRNFWREGSLDSTEKHGSHTVVSLKTLMEVDTKNITGEIHIYGFLKDVTQEEIDILNTLPKIKLVLYEEDIIPETLSTFKEGTELCVVSQDITQKISVDHLLLKYPKLIIKGILPVYNCNLLGPISSGIKQSLIFLGVDKTNYKRVEDFFREQINYLPKNIEEIVFQENTEEKDSSYLGTILALLRAKGIKSSVYDFLNYQYYADIMTTAIISFDLSHGYNYKLSAYQYQVVYTDNIEDLTLINIRLWSMYSNMRVPKLHSQNQVLGEVYGRQK